MLHILIYIGSLTASPITTIKSICGIDNRTASSLKPLGRMRGRGYCTGTLISKSCMISAGHCVSKNNKRYVEFNLKSKSPAGVRPKPAPEDIYNIDLTSIQYRHSGRGNDFSVFRLEQNVQTGKFPGEVQGTFNLYRFSPRPFSKVFIAGYGNMKSVPSLHLSQTMSTGSISTVASEIRHDVDTTTGASGAPVIMYNEIIGVHSHGGCSRIGYNSATSIFHNKEFAAAIEKCLASE